MKHIKEMVKQQLPLSYSVKNALKRTQSKLSWDHQMESQKRFRQASIAVSLTAALADDITEIDEIFKALTKECRHAQQVTEAEMTYVHQMIMMHENKGFVKAHEKKLETTENVSLLNVWDFENKKSESYKDEESMLEFLREHLTKDELAFNAKSELMFEMGQIVDEALDDPSIDNQYVMSKTPQRNKRGELKWGSVMGAVFWLGLAYKSVNKVEVVDHEERSFAGYVASQRDKLETELDKAKNADEEAGHYTLENQARVEELEARLSSYKAMAPYAERLFDYIDDWNVIEEWSYVENEEYDMIILNKTPKDQTLAEKREKLDEIIELMDESEEAIRQSLIKGAKGRKGGVFTKKSESFYKMIKEDLDASNKARNAINVPRKVTPLEL